MWTQDLDAFNRALRSNGLRPVTRTPLRSTDGSSTSKEQEENEEERKRW